MAHVSEEKKQVVKKVVDMINKYPIIGTIDMENLPAPQLQTMKSQLRGKVEIFMTKRRLIKVALDQVKESKKGIEGLVPKLTGMPALLFTSENPFSLFKTLKKSKSSAPAKPGQVAPKDIEVKAGPTPFLPGPIIGELGALGIKSGVENGKVAIKADKVVVQEGETITEAQASLLTRLGIQPMEIGLNVTSIYEDGIIYEKKVLDIDEEEFMSNLNSAIVWAQNLAVEIDYPTKDTIQILLGKAFRQAKAVGLEGNIIDEGMIDDLLGKAERSMLSLKSAANIEVPEKKAAPVEKKPEDKPAEQKSAEKPAETAPKEESQSTDDKVAEMVEKTKKHAKGEPSAQDIINQS
ncbi:MAG: 50S ribosomal protein L10 [Nanoarchaeota archaeon]|nr:50S ribosomal protein L10 [Nanoarchaeota archaeon]MBU1705009.1 50S ribosomal protein L10 [Nanoarchaeota archaeon]